MRWDLFNKIINSRIGMRSYILIFIVIPLLDSGIHLFIDSVVKPRNDSCVLFCRRPPLCPIYRIIKNALEFLNRSRGKLQPDSQSEICSCIIPWLDHGIYNVIPNTSAIKNKNQMGFTMVELIIAITLLSILAVGSVQFITFSALGYVDTARRSSLISTATILNEKISRIVRDALPGSIRVTANQRCVEVIPVVGSTFYTQAPFPFSPVSVDRNQVRALQVDGNLTATGFLAINTTTSDANDIYAQTNPGYVSQQQASIASTVANEVTFEFSGGALFEFIQESAQNRLYIAGSPLAFCQDGNQLYFYRNYGFIANIANLQAGLPSSLPNRLVIATGLQANSLRFSHATSTLQQNNIVAYELTLFDASNTTETLQINQEIHARNVP